MQCVFWSIQLIEVYPNTIDDKNLEYIEVRNTGCETIDLSNYTLEDALPKVYIIPSGTILDSHTNMRFGRPDTKLELNNVNESIHLRDPSGTLISEYAYENSVKGEPISISGVQDDTCDGWVEIYTGTGTGTGTISDSWTVFDIGDLDSSSSWISLETMWDISGSLADSWTTLQSSGWLWGSWETTATWYNTNIALSGWVFSSELAPLSLSYGDSDEDWYIDMLALEYGEVLTGILLPENISLYSQTGWLYLTGVITQSWYIIGSSLSGKAILLSIRESDIQKSLLRINNTTQSDLRLKSSWDIGITSIYGQKVAALFLTTSFNSYKNIVHPLTQADPSSTNLSSSWMSGSIVSSGSVFPDIIPTLQNYTNALFQSGIFLCSEKICRINLNFEPLFSSWWAMSDYICRIATGSIWLDTCNPPQWYFSQSGMIQFSLREKSTQGERMIQYPVIYLYQDVGISNIVSSLTGMIDQEWPVIVIDMDGKWKEYFEQIWDYELNCYAFTCGINFTAERSYDTSGWKIRFLWLYDMQNLSESKDPWTRYFSIWDHEVWLRVIDTAGNMSQVRYKIHVYPPKETRDDYKK
jgi:Lamin Tail Domain